MPKISATLNAFERKTLLCSRLNHSNIARLIDKKTNKFLI